MSFAAFARFEGVDTCASKAVDRLGYAGIERIRGAYLGGDPGEVWHLPPSPRSVLGFLIMIPDQGMTVADKLGIAGFVLAVIGLVWQAGFVFWQHRIRLRVNIFTKSAPKKIIVVEAVNLTRANAVQIRDVRIEWSQSSFVVESIYWKHDPLIQPLTLFQAVVPFAEFDSRGAPFPEMARGIVKTARGKVFKSKECPLSFG